MLCGAMLAGRHGWAPLTGVDLGLRADGPSSSSALLALPPGSGPDPAAWRFPWASADGLAPYLHSRTVSRLPTLPV